MHSQFNVPNIVAMINVCMPLDLNYHDCITVFGLQDRCTLVVQSHTPVVHMLSFSGFVAMLLPAQACVLNKHQSLIVVSVCRGCSPDTNIFHLACVEKYLKGIGFDK